MHRIKCLPSGLEFFTHARTPIKQNVDTMPVNTINISIENWVMVKYDKSLYAGEVAQILGNDIEVSAMEKSVKFWKWPNREDKVFYNMSENIKVIKPPTVINACGVFDFPDFLKNLCYARNMKTSANISVNMKLAEIFFTV
ncbi:hypothetical protein AVEN_94368-1 [Araneus ventricosus]|uniref:Uncharacterized protein n=1 Tax=Araneus ventricosus TaxID=182803 RepID=A0A4Y2EDK3_ARAVE|nr:hypothetical protein AVEN_94368-1 [Araneus ventricosus]